MKGKKNAGDHIKFSLLGDYEQVLNLLPLSFASVNEVNSIVYCPKIQKKTSIKQMSIQQKKERYVKMPK